MPLKEQNGNSQSTNGSQHAKHIAIKEAKLDIKEAKLDIKPAAATPAAMAWAGLPSARKSAAAGPAAAAQPDVKPPGLPGNAPPAKPMATANKPLAGRQPSMAATDDDGEEDDLKGLVLSKAELKRSLERRKKRKERAALAAAAAAAAGK